MKLFPFFGLCLLFLQCKAQNTTVITGTLSDPAGWKPTVYLIQPKQLAQIAASYMGTVVDSAQVGPDGRFAFRALPLTQDRALYQLCVQRQGERYNNRLWDEAPAAANYMPILLYRGQNLEIKSSFGHFQRDFSLGSPAAANRSLLALRDLRLWAYDTLSQTQKALEGQPEEAVLMEHEAAWHRFQAPLMRFADTCAHLEAALVAVRWVSPAGDYERIPEFLRSQCARWGQPEAGQFAAELCQLAHSDKMPVIVGDPIPDAPMPMVNGDTVQLRSLLGAKLTILDIWASWCMPCRKENKNVLQPLWQQYQSRGLRIVGYSIDSSPAAWRNAIAKDGAAWAHASHLQGDDAPYMQTLRITTIPANYLLDGEGKILAKNLHGDALNAFVKAYLENGEK